MKLRVEERNGPLGPQMVLVAPDGSVIEGQTRVTVTDEVECVRRVTVELTMMPDPEG